MKLKGKIAIITGGSRGIGKAIARAFLAESASVAIAGRNQDELTKTSQELSRFGVIRSFRADISEEKDIQKLVAEVLDTFGTIDVLVNNAAVQGPIGKFWEVGFDDWVNNININLLGTARCIREVLPIMIAKKAGKIINLSGGGATAPRAYFSAYAAGKAAVVRFTETLAEELREYHIDVNAIAPGAVNTRMLDEVLAAEDRAGDKELREAKKRKEKGGTPPELAAALAVFLASSASDGLSGRLISAVWDDWMRFGPDRIQEVMSGDLYTLRRVSQKG